ncbi:MAG: hypothetical protein WBM99_07145 [Psychromonas sp.]
MYMKKSLIALAVATSLTALTGCGGGDGGDVAAASTVNYSGTVNKGIVSNGKVEVCDVFDDAGCNEGDSSFYYETITSEDGSYDVTGAPTETPLLVLVSEADEGATTMKCDLATCNEGAVAFGESFTVDSGWALQAIVPSATSGTTVNVTALTDLAADEAIEVAGNGGVTEAIATNANNAVRAAFGLTNSIIELGALDLTDAEAVVAALTDDTEELMAATYSAVLLDVSDTDKKAMITFDNSTGGYTVNVASTKSILEKASTLLSTVETKANAALTEANAISVASTQAEIAAVVIPTAVDAVEQSDELVASKAFITDVRTAYNAVQDGGDLATGLEDFADELEGIDDLASGDLDTISERLTQAITAIAEAFENADGATEYEADNGYTVTISGDTYSINEEDGDVQVTATVTGTITDSETDTETGEEWSGSADVELTLTKVSIGEDDTTLSATGIASVVGLKADGSWSESSTSDGDAVEWSEEESGSVSIDSASIKLEAELVYASDASFTGAISFSFNDLSYKDTSNYAGGYTEGTSTGEEQGAESFTVGDMNLVLEGELAANEETLGVYLSLLVDNSSGYTQKYSWSDAWEYTWNSTDYSSEETADSTNYSSEETADSFVTLSAIARVETTLVDADNKDMTASIELNASRNEYDVVDTTITINYNDVDVILDADVGIYGNTSSDLTVRNTAGVVATINALNDSDEKYQGTLNVNNVNTASIEEGDNGAVWIRYTDGTFSSLF